MRVLVYRYRLSTAHFHAVGKDLNIPSKDSRNVNAYAAEIMIAPKHLNPRRPRMMFNGF